MVFMDQTVRLSAEEAGMAGHLLGREAEREFDRECKARGIMVQKAEGKMNASDRLVLGVEAMHRVQIKSTATLRRVNKGRAKGKVLGFLVANRREDKAKTRYADSGVDVIAVWVKPHATWYLLNAWEWGGASIFIPLTLGPKGRKARNNWGIFA